MEGITVLSLFDGMSCGQIALKNLGIPVKAYYASEIDKFAIKVTQHNFPDTIQLGDVTKVEAKDLPKIDLCIAGSPCQGFSFAGKGLNFEDPRSKLFFEFVRLVKECQPTYWMLENVQMKKEHEYVISRIMDVSPLVINSALVSAQNRVRNYWTNIANKPYGILGEVFCAIPQPKDKGILLKDVLEKEVPEKYFINSKSMLDFVTDQWRLDKKYVQINGEKAITQQARQYSSWCGDYVKEASIKFGRTDEGKQIRKESMKNGKDYTPFQAKEITGLDFEKMNTLTTVRSKDNLVFTKNYVQWEGNGFKQDNRGAFENSKSLTLDTKPKRNKVLTEDKIRRLTPTECKRLQTIPDWYDMSVVSDSQQYKMLGNGWTVSVVSHILSFIDFNKI